VKIFGRQLASNDDGFSKENGYWVFT
jgi:hypothetical protein